MDKAEKNMENETTAKIRDQILKIKK